MSKIAISALRQKLELQQASVVADNIGGRGQTWQTVAEVWAKIETSSHQRTRDGAREETRTAHRITIRWRPDVSQANRFKSGSSVYSIHAVQDLDGMREFMVCSCQEMVP